MGADSALIWEVWRYPLFEALYGRRTRRFGRGFRIAEEPFTYTSRTSPLPLRGRGHRYAFVRRHVVRLSGTRGKRTWFISEISV